LKQSINSFESNLSFLVSKKLTFEKIYKTLSYLRNPLLKYQTFLERKNVDEDIVEFLKMHSEKRNYNLVFKQFSLYKFKFHNLYNIFRFRNLVQSNLNTFNLILLSNLIALNSLEFDIIYYRESFLMRKFLDEFYANKFEVRRKDKFQFLLMRNSLDEKDFFNYINLIKHFVLLGKIDDRIWIKSLQTVKRGLMKYYSQQSSNNPKDIINFIQLLNVLLENDIGGNNFYIKMQNICLDIEEFLPIIHFEKFLFLLTIKNKSRQFKIDERLIFKWQQHSKCRNDSKNNENFIRTFLNFKYLPTSKDDTKLVLCEAQVKNLIERYKLELNSLGFLNCIYLGTILYYDSSISQELKNKILIEIINISSNYFNSITQDKTYLTEYRYKHEIKKMLIKTFKLSKDTQIVSEREKEIFYKSCQNLILKKFSKNKSDLIYLKNLISFLKSKDEAFGLLLNNI
jgi:hypothetical protein